MLYREYPGGPGAPDQDRAWEQVSEVVKKKRGGGAQKSSLFESKLVKTSTKTFRLVCMYSKYFVGHN